MRTLVESWLSARPSLPDVDVISFLVGQKTDHFIYFFLLLLVSLVADEGWPILRDALLPVSSLLALEALSALLALDALLLLVLNKLDENLIFAVSGAIRCHCMYDRGALISNQLLAIDTFSFGLLPDVVILQSDQSLFQLLFGQMQRTYLWLLLGPALFLGVCVVVLVMIHCGLYVLLCFSILGIFYCHLGEMRRQEVVL